MSHGEWVTVVIASVVGIGGFTAVAWAAWRSCRDRTVE